MKKLFATLGALVMLYAGTGCGGDKKSSNPTGPDLSTPVPTYTSVPTQTPTITPCMVTFSDTYLDSAVRAKINKPSGQLYNTDLVGVGFTSLYHYGGNVGQEMISNLSGIQYCTDLTFLNLWGNNISNINALSSLKKLETLYLQQNSISDISALSGLTKLKDVVFTYNGITDLTPLVTNCNNGGLGIGDKLNVQENPLTTNSKDVQIPYLQSKGVTVTY